MVKGSGEKLHPEDKQFAYLAEDLLKLMHMHYMDDAQAYTQSDDSHKITTVIYELDVAKKDLNTGQIEEINPAIINIFDGLQTSDQSHTAAHKNHIFIESLYNLFNQKAGLKSEEYTDIEKDTRDQLWQSFIFTSNSSYSNLVRGDKLALVEGGAPVGILIKLSENIIASFKLGNFGAPQLIGETRSRVDLIVTANVE